LGSHAVSFLAETEMESMEDKMQLNIYNATWIPASKQVDLEEAWIRQSSSFANISILSVFKRTCNQ